VENGQERLAVDDEPQRILKWSSVQLARGHLQTRAALTCARRDVYYDRETFKVREGQGRTNWCSHQTRMTQHCSTVAPPRPAQRFMFKAIQGLGERHLAYEQMKVSHEFALSMVGAGMALAGSLVFSFFRRRLAISERALRIGIVLIMIPFNPFILLGKTLGLGYATGTGLFYIVLQGSWLIALIAFLGDVGWLMAGTAIGLHLCAILFRWEFYFNEDW
jgi:hypothetical protein